MEQSEAGAGPQQAGTIEEAAAAGFGSAAAEVAAAADGKPSSLFLFLFLSLSPFGLPFPSLRLDFYSLLLIHIS